MKVLLYCLDPISTRLISKAVEAAGHLVTGTVSRPSLWIEAIVREAPHLLFVVGAIPDDVAEDMARLFPDLVIRITPTDDWSPALAEELARPTKPLTPRRYADGPRRVFHDDALADYAKGKLHRPSQGPGWETDCQMQEAFFLLQLHTARSNHDAARRYLACLAEQQGDLDREIAYRVAHNSWKGLCWSRDLALRYCAVLAHYCHGVDLDYLLSPHPVSPHADYVHHQATFSSWYAVAVNNGNFAFQYFPPPN